MFKIHFDVNFANGVAMDVANDLIRFCGWTYTRFALN